MSEFTDEELLAISNHVTACLAARQAATSIAAARPSTSLSAPLSSSSPSRQPTSMSLHEASSIASSRSSPKHKRSTGEASGARTSRRSSKPAGKATRKRVTSSSTSRAKASALRANKRSKSQEWLQAKIRQNMKKAARAGAHEVSGGSSVAGPSSPRTPMPTPRQTRASSSRPTRSPGAESTSSRQLRPQLKRSRDEVGDNQEASMNHDDTPRRSKRSRRN